MTSTTSPRRRTLIATTGVLAGLALAVAAPLAASAHVHVSPGEAPAGSTTRLTFSFSHGCDGSPTTALIVELPAEVSNATPVLDGAWTIARELRADGTPARLTFTAVRPVETGVAASVFVDALIATSAAESVLAFPVTQKCVDGSAAWDEVAEEGEDAAELDSPAPLVAVGPVVEDADGHGHGAGAADDEHAVGAAGSSPDPVARWLAGGALVAALGALGLALARGRSRPS